MNLKEGDVARVYDLQGVKAGQNYLMSNSWVSPQVDDTTGTLYRGVWYLSALDLLFEMLGESTRSVIMSRINEEP